MLENILMWLGFGLCHQLPERSLTAGGLQAPVCARDMGIYLGFAIGLGVLVLLDRGRRSSEPPPLTSALVLVGLIGVMVADGLTSYMGLRSTTNEIRLLTGVCAGFGISGLVLPMLNGQLWRRFGVTRILASNGELALFVLAVPVAYATGYYLLPHLGAGMAVVTAGTIVFTFTIVNLVLVCLMPRFERRAERLREVWVAAGIALVVTAVELAMAVWLRMWLLSIAGLL